MTTTGERKPAKYMATRAERDAELDAFWAVLAWRPINQYDRAAAPIVLLRRGEQWDIGSWRAVHPDLTAFVDPVDPLGPAWRNSFEPLMEHRLAYEPTEFAAIDDDWAARLMEL